MINFDEALRIINEAVSKPEKSGEADETQGKWRFNRVKKLSEPELAQIKEYSQNRLPQSFYRFLEFCGVGEFFAYGDYGEGGVEFFDLAQMKELNETFAQDIADELADAGEESPDIGEIFIVGIHNGMGDLAGFDLSEEGRNFAVFCHECPSVYYAAESEFASFEEYVIKCVASRGEDTL